MVLEPAVVAQVDRGAGERVDGSQMAPQPGLHARGGQRQCKIIHVRWAGAGVGAGAPEVALDCQLRQREAIDAQFRAGAAERLDTLNSEVELAGGELAQLDGRVKLQQSIAALEDAVQRPIDTIKPSIIESHPMSARENQP